MADPAAPPPKKENVLTRKLGPLPTWVWVAIAAAVLLVIVLWHGRKGSGGQPQQAAPHGFGRAFLPPVVIHGARGPRGRPGEDDDDDDDKRRRKHRRHRRDRDDAAASPEVTTRPVPGQAAAGPAGSLVSFTTPASGPAPSLAQVASQYNTAPDAIVEEATGRGSPHGALWRRYVAAHDWEAPLPHGTDMTVLAQPR